MTQVRVRRARARNGRRLLVGAGAALVLTLGVASCFNYAENDCWRTNACPPAASGPGGAGGDGGIVAGCVPSMNAEPVAESCGVFVSNSQGDDADDGSQAKPVRTLARAIDLAATKGMPVYACAEMFDEAVTMSAGTMLYGGLDCADGWRHIGVSSKTIIAPGPDLIPVTFAGGAKGTHLEDVVGRASDAMTDGGSSIAALAEEGAGVELVRCELGAGNARDGAKGATPSDPLGPTDPNDPGISGANGAAACMGDLAAGNLGGNGAVNATCMVSAGGKGGAGMVTTGADGTDGQPAGALGKHGTGQPAMNSWTCADGNGQVGGSGANGPNGAGASMADLGMLSSAGFTGASGSAGTDGAPGQGGGGGGGAKGKAGCNGASGGGGGAGGCGGKGGLSGQGGGSSIALVSLGATFTFTEVTLTASNAGNGGEGGDGQGGAIGGAGGFGGPGDTSAPTTQKGCAGGEGGPGGTGGKGGGGRGGHSLGIAFQGSAPPSDSVTIVVGKAGQGGVGADVAGQGANGVASPTQAFP